MAGEDDIYSALIGGAPTDPQRQAMLAAQLRNQANQGRFLQLSGDRVIAPFGQQMESEAMKGATGVAGEREREANLRMMQEYRIAQEANMVDKIRAMYGVQGMKGDVARDVANIRAEASEYGADVRGQGTHKLAEGERKELNQFADSVESLRGIIQDFKPQYAGTGRGMKNWIAQYGLGPKDWQEAQDWWARYNREFSLNEIHRLFGARFTQPEQTRFEAGHVNANMQADQVMEKLQSIEPHILNQVRGRLYDYQGYNDPFIGNVATRLGVNDFPQQVPTPTGKAPHGAASSFPSGSAAAPYSMSSAPGAAPTAPAPSVGDRVKGYLQGPAYMMTPGAIPPQSGGMSMAPGPFVRPTPPMNPGGMNLFQGIGGVPGG